MSKGNAGGGALPHDRRAATAVTISPPCGDDRVRLLLPWNRFAQAEGGTASPSCFDPLSSIPLPSQTPGESFRLTLLMTGPEAILVIEDHEDLRAGIAIALDLHGYAVETAANGLQALLMLQAGLRPCLIVMDLMMPVMSGFEFRERQLADPHLRGIPLIAYSGITDPWKTAQHLGAVAYLHKPVDMEQFTAVVRQFCPNGARRQPSA